MKFITISLLYTINRTNNSKIHGLLIDRQIQFLKCTKTHLSISYSSGIHEPCNYKARIIQGRKQVVEDPCQITIRELKITF